MQNGCDSTRTACRIEFCWRNIEPSGCISNSHIPQTRIVWYSLVSSPLVICDLILFVSWMCELPTRVTRVLCVSALSKVAPACGILIWYPFLAIWCLSTNTPSQCDVRFLFLTARTLLNNILRRKVNWIGHILRRNCLLHYAIEGQMTEMKGLGRRTQLLDDLRNRRRYWELIVFVFCICFKGEVIASQCTATFSRLLCSPEFRYY